MSHARSRSGWGMPVRFPSRFLSDIPSNLLVYERRIDQQLGGPNVGPLAGNAHDDQVVPSERSFRDGQRVRHRVFGDGLVVAGEFIRLDEEVTVMFDSVGLKRLAVNVANLEALN